MTTTKTLPDLSGFTGSQEFYRHALNRRVIYTEGVQHLAESVGAYWLVDEIAIAQAHDTEIRAQPFQVWKLAVKDNAAQLTTEDGNDNVVASKRIEFTDFPEPGVTVWCVGGDGVKTVLLPSEY